jgi:hypothetical protein
MLSAMAIYRIYLDAGPVTVKADEAHLDAQGFLELFLNGRQVAVFRVWNFYQVEYRDSEGE